MQGGADGAALAKEMLALCDALRSDALPRLGVRLLDGKAGGTSKTRGWVLDRSGQRGEARGAKQGSGTAL